MAVNERGAPVSAVVSARSFFVFPTQKLEYYFSVGNGSEVAKVNVPLDFTFSEVLDSAFGDFAPGRYIPLASQFLQEGGLRKRSSYTVTQDGERREYAVYWLSVGKKVKKGEKIISFDILTGDLLFVDRFTYNFFAPKVGQGFVFKTDNIHSPNMEKPQGSGNQIKQYYIKRLVGTPGDVLEVKSSVLLSNGQAITGAAAFNKNARREGLYRGYENIGLLSMGQRLTIPEHHYFAMGDNSYRSADSRYWGFVPEKDVVGKPLFIYYPLTKRWGPAQ
jgi:signal peptidase I